MTALLFLHSLRLFRRTAVATRIAAIVYALVLVTAPASAQAPLPPDSKVQALLQQAREQPWSQGHRRGACWTKMGLAG